MRLALAFLLLLCAAARADMPREDLWYERFVNDKRVGWEHHVLQRVRGGGWQMRYEGEDRWKSYGVEELVRYSSDVLYASDFGTLREEHRHQDGEQVTVYAASVAGGKAHFTRTINGRSEGQDIDLGTKKVHDPIGPYLASLRLGPGDRFTDATTETSSMQVSEVTLTVEGQETLSAAGAQYDCLRIRYEESLFPGVILRMWVTAGGVLVQDRRGASVHRLATKEQAQRPLVAEELASRPRVRPTVYFPGRFEEATFTVRIGGDPVDGLLPEGPYQHVVASKDSLRVTLLPQPAPEGPTVPFPVTDPALAKWLKPAPVLCLDDPVVRAKAREAIGLEKDALAAARKAVHWVFANIGQEISQVASMTAKETLTEGKGDCNELSVVVAAFCREEGIPARLAHGFLWAGYEFGYHQWAEVWAGRWVPVDPTRDLVGLPPAFMLVGIDDEGGPEEAALRARATRMHGRAAFTFESVKEGGMERAVREEDGAFQGKGDRFTSFGWGVGFALPSGWTQSMSKGGLMVLLHGEGFPHAELYPLSLAGPITMDLAHRGGEDLLRTLQEGRIVLEEVRDEADRRVFTCEGVGKARGASWRGRFVCVESRGRTVVARFFARDGKEFDDAVPSFDAFVDSLQFP